MNERTTTSYAKIDGETETFVFRFSQRQYEAWSGLLLQHLLLGVLLAVVKRLLSLLDFLSFLLAQFAQLGRDLHVHILSKSRTREVRLNIVPTFSAVKTIVLKRTRGVSKRAKGGRKDKTEGKKRAQIHWEGPMIFRKNFIKCSKFWQNLYSVITCSLETYLFSTCSLTERITSVNPFEKRKTITSGSSSF